MSHEEEKEKRRDPPEGSRESDVPEDERQYRLRVPIWKYFWDMYCFNGALTGNAKTVGWEEEESLKGGQNFGV